MDVVNEDTGEKYFLKGNYYTGLVEENSLFAFDEKNHKQYIAGSKGGSWHTDDWFLEHFLEDKKKTNTILKEK
jgi:hypothetical protein